MNSLPQSGLPNYLREQLIQAGHTSLARVYDALAMLKWDIATPFTEGQILRALKPYGIGRRSLRQALLSVGFHQLDQVKMTRGRPARLYQARDLVDLQRQLYIVPDVSPSQRSRHPALSSDAIKPTDLAPGHYKRALHLALIRRREGLTATRRWLAARLNVCARTLRRWEKELRIRVEKQIEYHVLTASMVADLPEALADRRPIWLEAFGMKWRATQHTAEFLLHQTIDVVAARQKANRYYFD